MPGFGNYPFGSYSFGDINWPEIVTYEKLPSRWRERDADLGFPLRDFLDPYQRELDALRFKIRELNNQRDPLDAIAIGLNATIEIESSVVIQDDFWGRTIDVTVAIGEDISAIGIGWTTTVEVPVAAGTEVRTYKVVRVTSRNEPDTRNKLLLAGPSVPIGVTEAVFRNPSLLKLLGMDFGIEVDNEEPESFQRSTVKNSVRLRALKGSAKGYAVRGDMAGFKVDAIGLYRQSSQVLSIPADRRYEIPAGSGQFYTDVPPQAIRFDEIPSDIQTDDPDLGTIPILDFAYLFTDTSGNLQSPGLTFSENVLVGYQVPDAAPVPPADLIAVVSSSPALQPVLDALMIGEAWNVTVTMTQAQRDLVGFISRGVFILKDNVTGDEFYIEREESYVGGSSMWTVTTSGPIPPPNSDYKLKYFPTMALSCSWCRSNVMVFEIENTPALIAGLGGDGAAIQRVYERLLVKLLRLVPIHVRVGAIIKRINFEVDAGIPASVTLGVTGSIIFMSAPFQAYYDIVAADVIPVDSIGPTITMTVVTTP